jgi:tRNA(fMet)-specific endonuclease VapC
MTESSMESLRFLLDTNIVSHLVRNPQGIVRDRIAEVGEQTVCVSLLVAAELRFGAAKKKSARLTRQVEAVLAVLPILPLETPVDAHYAEIRVELETSGSPLGPNDLIIAAHARALGLTLVTHNLVEFSCVPGLLVQNWLS